jgi:hypothetical protein
MPVVPSDQQAAKHASAFSIFKSKSSSNFKMFLGASANNSGEQFRPEVI